MRCSIEVKVGRGVISGNGVVQFEMMRGASGMV